MSLATTHEMVTSDVRTNALESYIANATRHGWRVQSQGATSAQLVKGKPTNHILHLILTLITLGLWAIVWILMVIFAGEKQRHVSVTEQGNIVTS